MLKSILEAVALPPLCFLYCLMAGLFIVHRRPRLGRAMIGVGLVCFLLLGLPPVADLLLYSLERDVPPAASDASARAIVVLGGDVARTGDPTRAHAGPMTLERLVAGAALHRRTGLPILVTGGIVHPSRASVGHIMAESLRDDFRTPAAWEEDVSRDTWENALYSAAILKQHDIGAVYVVTHAWHMRRSLLAFRRAGLTAIAAPTPPDALSGSDIGDYIPRISAWQRSYFALHEWIGCAVYALR